jgi:transporter family-2 protein
MSTFILLALINGLFIGLSRSLNGQLSLSKGAFNASFYNHLVGFLLLSLILIGFGLDLKSMSSGWASGTWYLYLGGLIGALYVALNSYVLNKMGATKAALLVISGQMITGVLLDYFFNRMPGNLLPYMMQALGVVFIILGIVYSQKKPIRLSGNLPVPK